MLEGYRHLSLEVGDSCNLENEHPWCPSGRDRFPRMQYGSLDADKMLDVIDDAVRLGFAGYVGFHFYNEPLLRRDVIREVIERSDYDRFMLWTNGILLTQDDADLFEWVVVTRYNGYDYSHLDDIKHPNISVYPEAPDGRGDIYGNPAKLRVNCWRQQVEIPIDYYGNVHLCCQDWRGFVGNVFHIPLEAIMRRFREQRISLMSDGLDVPRVCRKCTGQLSFADYERGRV